MATFSADALLSRFELIYDESADRNAGVLSEVATRLKRTPPETPEPPSGEQLARWIDHTQLKPEATPAKVEQLLDECLEYRFASACIPPSYVQHASEKLSGSEVAVCTVIGFPLGANHSTVKADEAEQAVRDGATEVDMVLSIGRLKGEQYDLVEEDIRGVVKAVGDDTVVKVILETALLEDNEKAVACVLAERAGADFVKTSTGFSSGGATLHDVDLMHQVVGGELGIKASGGVGSAEEAAEMIRHGATRIGASGSVSIMEGTSSDADY